MRFGIGLHLSYLRLRRRLIGLQQVVQQFIDVLFVLRHAVAQHTGRIVLVTHQVRQLQAGVHDILHHLTVVQITLRGFGVVGHIELLAQRTVLGILHERGVAWVGQVEDPTRHVVVLRLLRRSLNDGRRQAGQIRRIGDGQFIGVRGVQDILPILQRQEGQAFAELAELLLALLRKRRTVLLERFIGLRQQHLLLRRQPQRILLQVNRLDPLEQGSVQRHVIGVLRLQRRDLLGEAVHRGAGLGLQQIVENILDTGQILAGALQRHDRVLERRRFGVLHNSVDLLIMESNRLFHRR